MEWKDDHSKDQSEEYGRKIERTVEGKDKYTKRISTLCEHRKGLGGQKKLIEYYIYEGETIEITALLLGGTKNKSLSPTPMRTEREKKRKESEPYIDVSGLEEEKLESATSEEETVTTKKWMTSMMKEMKERTDDMSEFERSMTGVKFEMNEVKSI